MDVKALAKSKRAHSQHHSKKHHHHSSPTPKAPVSSVKQTQEKPSKSQSSKGALPSNRDRYEDEEYGSDLEDLSRRINQGSDGVAPKSKGADFTYLISEAKSRPEANVCSDSFPWIDDDVLLTDFNLGFGSLLSVRGEGIRSWSGDDNFIVEDKASTTTREASFLSLNLHLLAEQIEKVDLPGRLFIEPELFLGELSSEQLNKASEELDQLQATSESKETNKNSDELILKMKDGKAELDTLVNTFSGAKFFDSSTNSKKFDHSFVGQQEEIASISEQTSVVRGTPALPSKRDLDLSSSDAIVANFDDDLDKLLQKTSASVWRSNTSSVNTARSQPSFKGSDFPVSSSRKDNFDDVLDDILLETSFDRNKFQGNSSVQMGPSQSTKTNKDLSKTVSVIASFDDELDDLLNETSNLTNEKGTSQSSKIPSSRHGHTSSSFGPVPKTKVLDDFDSFFDTL